MGKSKMTALTGLATTRRRDPKAEKGTKGLRSMSSAVCYGYEPLCPGQTRPGIQHQKGLNQLCVPMWRRNLSVSGLRITVHAADLVEKVEKDR